MMQIRNRLLTGLVLLFGCAHLVSQEEAPLSNLWPAVPVPEATDATSLKIIDLHLKARGGPALDALRSVQFGGTIVEGLVDHSIIMTHARPKALLVKKYRYHLGYDHTTWFATNGEQAWQRVTQPKKQLPRVIGGKPALQLNFEAMLPFLFTDPGASGFVYAYKGEREFAGRSAYVLHGWHSTGYQIEVFFDTRSFQIINYRYPWRIASTNVLVDRMPTGLKQVDGIWWETGCNLKHRNKVFQTLSFNTIEVNVDIDNGAFSMPEIKEFWLRPKTDE